MNICNEISISNIMSQRVISIMNRYMILASFEKLEESTWFTLVKVLETSSNTQERLMFVHKITSQTET